MGFRICWLAVRGLPREVVLARLGLGGTGERQEVPEAPVVGAQFPDGWYVVVCNRTRHRFLRDPVLERVSAGCEVVTCDVDEDLDRTAASGWKRGRRVWSLRYDPDQELDELETQGDLPPAFEAIRAELELAWREDPGLDYRWELPIEVAEAMCGFRHDTDVVGADGGPFDVLVNPAELGAGFQGLRLTVEDEPVFEAPSPELLRDVVGWLSPRGGPSFVVLEGRGEDYTQAAGGDGVFTAEWREYLGADFRHWVAGRPDLPADAGARVPTNGAHVSVCQNELLAADDVRAILVAYARGEARPGGLAWRDATERFH
jgi:hypothetical protein